MKVVPESAVDLVDLVDLKMLPAWVNEPAQAEPYSRIEGEQAEHGPGRPLPGGRHGRKKRPTPKAFASRLSKSQPAFARDGLRRGERPTSKSTAERDFRTRRTQHREDRRPTPPPPSVTVQFLPHPPALASVVAQIKENSVAYSLFALARLFLEKPQRYDVRLKASADSPLLQLGENGGVSVNRHFLEHNAFRLAESNFYRIDITQGEPIKGNFTNVARCKLSGTLLGPTNHHDYQKRLRKLYEQRFSGRMSFADYQRQIEIVTDPQLVEQWKEDARKITTFTTLKEETPATFASVSDAERHFRETYLPGLIRTKEELIIDGVASRSLSDRVLRHLIESEWVEATRSPSGMMQELASEFRQAGLHVFRHRRGMLFVSPIRIRPLSADAPMSPSIQAIIENVSATPGIGRKELADKLITNLAVEETEHAKLALASDLRWLVSEGHIIEFNDGSLDLPRWKPKAVVEAALPAANEQQQNAEPAAVEADASAEKETSTHAQITEPVISLVDAEIGGS